MLTLNIHGNANQSNYITFQHRGKSIGSIEKVDTKLSASDLASHVRLKGTGADYAEWMYKLDLKETFHVADIVAVKDGKITKNTKHASCLKVISSSAIVLGNWKGSKLEKRMEQVAFLGQVPVKIRGAVCAGDFVIPSGKHDGTGQAVSPSKITASQYQQIVGVAWETSNLEGLKTVHVAVGQNTPEVKIAELMRASEYKTAEIQDLKVQNETLKANYLMLQQKVEKQQQQINQLLQMFQK